MFQPGPLGTLENRAGPGSVSGEKGPSALARFGSLLRVDGTTACQQDHEGRNTRLQDRKSLCEVLEYQIELHQDLEVHKKI